ncbi:MAG: hypothetical protein ACK559_22320, partial [bacterium]
MKGHLWLEHAINCFNHRTTTADIKNLQIPMKSDGTPYIMDEAQGIQRIILYHVFDTLKKWIFKKPDYKPFHRIISGAGGSGKS